MKSLLLAAFAIGLPLALMLVINWAMSDPGAAAPAQVVTVETSEAQGPRPQAVRPGGDVARQWPVELVPARGMLPLPDAGATSPRRYGNTRKAAEAGRAGEPLAAAIASPELRAASAATASTAAPGMVERIEDWLEDWQQRAKTGPDSRRAAAMQALARGEFERAAVAFDRLLLQNPNDADLIMGEVLALTRLGRHEDALPLLAALLEREPKNTAARYHCGATLARLNRRAEAIDAFTQVLEVSPGHDAAMYNLATLQQSLGRRQDAWATWRKLTERLAQELTPAPSQGALGQELVCAAWFHRGEAEMAMSQVKEAQRCFLEVTRRAPNDARGWCNLGIARAALAEYDEATPALMTALRLEPTLVAAMNQLAYIHAVKYRDTRRVEDRQAVLDWCSRSLAVQSQQPNIQALSSAVLDADQQPAPDKEAETPAGNTPTPSPIHARP